ncbi:uro-adherence factor A-like isoform X2 [Onthophagus taurus]
MPRETEDNYVIEPKTTPHLNCNPNRSHVGRYPREIQLFPLELRPVIDDQERRKFDFYNEIRLRKLQEQRRREDEMMDNRQQMSEKRFRVPRRPRGCDEETCPALNRSSCTQGSDVYRNILGPTPDESILAGLQTVIEICGLSDVCHIDSDATDSRLLTTSSRNTTYTSQDYSLRRTTSDSSQDDSYSSRPRYSPDTNWCHMGRRPCCRCDLHDQCPQRYQHFPRECVPMCPCANRQIGDSLPSTSFHCGLPRCPVPLYKDEKRTEKKGTIEPEPHLRNLKNKSDFRPRKETTITGLMTMHPEKARKFNVALHEDVIGIVDENDTQTKPILKNDKGTTMSKAKLKPTETPHILKPEQESSISNAPKKLSFLLNQNEHQIEVSPESSTSIFIAKGTSIQPQSESDEKILHIYEGSINTENDKNVPDDKNVSDDKKNIVCSGSEIECLQERPPLVNKGSSGFTVSERIRERKSAKIIKQNKHIKSTTSMQSYEEISSSFLPIEHETKQDYKLKQKTTKTQLYRNPYSYEKVSKGELVTKHAQGQKFRTRKPSSTISILKPRPYQSVSKAEIVKELELKDEYLIRKALSSTTILGQSYSYEAVKRQEIIKKLEQNEKYHIKKALSSSTMLKQSRHYDMANKGEILKKFSQKEKYDIKKSLSTVSLRKRPASMEKQSYIFPTQAEIAKRAYINKKMEINTSLQSVSSSAQQYIFPSQSEITKRAYINKKMKTNTSLHSVSSSAQQYIFPTQSEIRKRAYINEKMKINTSLQSIPSSAQQYYQAIDVRDIVESQEAPKQTKSINFDLSDHEPSLHSAPITREPTFESLSMSSKRMQMRHSFPITSKNKYDSNPNLNEAIIHHPDTHRLLIVPISVNQSYEAVGVEESPSIIEEISKKDDISKSKSREVSKTRSRDESKSMLMHKSIEKSKDRSTNRSLDRNLSHQRSPLKCNEAVGIGESPCIIGEMCKNDETCNELNDESMVEPSHGFIPRDISNRQDISKTKSRDMSKTRSKDKPKSIPMHKSVENSKDRSTNRSIDRNLSCQRSRLKSNDLEENLKKTSSGAQKVMKKSSSSIDKCCGPSSHERYPWSKFRLNKSISGGSWDMSWKDSRDLTAQNFPPVNLPSSKSFLLQSCVNEDYTSSSNQCLCPSCQYRPKTSAINHDRGSQKSVVVQDPKKFVGSSSVFDRKYVCNRDYVFPPHEDNKKVKDFRASGMSVPPIVQPVIGVCTDRKCGGTGNEKLLDVRYSVVRISTFTDYTTYEILKSSAKKPRKMPCIVEGIFVTKR